MAGSRYIIPTPQYMDTAGRPAVGYKLYSYEGGTTTPKVTYSDAALTSANANPTIGDNNGYFGTIYTDPDTSYKFVMKDADDNTIWTQDAVYSGVGSEGIETGNIADGAVTTAKIADNAVTAAKIADTDAIDTTAKLADGIVTGAKLAAGTSTIYVSSNDTTEGVLNGKLVAGNNVTLTEGSDGGDETLTVDYDFRGAVAIRATTAFSVANNSATALEFNSEVYDTSSFHDNSTNPSRITIPANVSYAKFTFGIVWASDSTGDREVYLYKNGSPDPNNLSVIDKQDAMGSDSTTHMVSSPVLSVSETDYFEVYGFQDPGGALDMSTGSWFAIEVWE
jgi:hypothetical protein